MSNKPLTEEQRESIRKGVLKYYKTAKGLQRIEQLRGRTPWNKGRGVKREKRLIRPILQFSKKNDRLVRVWDSITAASTEMKLSYQAIWYCCKGLRKTAGGFRWVYR